jgi:hypothetical protein
MRVRHLLSKKRFVLNSTTFTVLSHLQKLTGNDETAYLRSPRSECAQFSITPVPLNGIFQTITIAPVNLHGFLTNLAAHFRRL